MDRNDRSRGPRVLRNAVFGASAVDLALRLTLLDLLLRPVGSGWIRPILLGLAGAGLLLPGILRTPGLWGWLAIGTGARVAIDYPLPDNHAYLLVYWCFAIFLALRTTDSAAFLATSARCLIGLVFAFATLWKAGLSPDFADGTFFRVTLLTDPRFADLARVVGNLSAESLAALRGHLLQHADVGQAAPSPLPYPPALWALASGLTGWTLAIEAFLAAAFLWPGARGPARWRDAALLTFCATTFAVATVEGFGWLLLAIGVAQCPPERTRTRALYLATFALILGYREIPWSAALVRWLAPG